jgi:diacylglycerol O-acyltransferase
VAPRPVLDVPRTPLNGPLSARRAFATRSLSLDAIRAVKSAVDVSVNDVLLGLVASSLRAYLARRDALPAAPLVVEVPTATDVAADPPRLQGNRVSNLFTSLRTDVADPVERLRAIHEAIGEAKRTNEILGPELFREWTEFTPPRPFAWAVRQYVRHRLARHHAPPINAIVSSVAGPRRRLHWSEGSLESISSVGPLVEGVALNVTAWSYVDRMNVGVLVCPDLVDGLDEIADGIAAALDELVRALVSPHAA